MIKILLRETEIEQEDETVVIQIAALHPEDGSPMCHIPATTKPIWCNNDGLSTEYNHAEGIYWNTWEEAEKQLSGHEIYTDGK